MYITISDRFPTMTLIVEVVSGQHIPRPKNDDDTSDIMDPYVQVRSSYIEYRKGGGQSCTKILSQSSEVSRWSTIRH